MNKITFKRNSLFAALIAATPILATQIAHAEVVGDVAQIQTTVNAVNPDNICDITIEPPASTAFTADYSYENGSETFTPTNASSPLYISVKTSQQSNCKLSNVLFRSPFPSGANRSNKWAAIVPFGSSGGGWKFGMSYADYAVKDDHEDTAYTRPPVTVGHGFATSDQYFTFGTGVAEAAGTGGTNTGAEKGSWVLLNDTHHATKGGMYPQELLGWNDGGTVALAPRNTTATYAEVRAGIAGVAFTSPINLATGSPDPEAAADGDKAQLTFTVNVTMA